MQKLCKRTYLFSLVMDEIIGDLKKLKGLGEQTVGMKIAIEKVKSMVIAKNSITQVITISQ